MILALDICDSHPEACAAPIDVTRLQTDGVWSREKQNNPFADYYKVRLDICIPKSFEKFSSFILYTNSKIYAHHVSCYKNNTS